MGWFTLISYHYFKTGCSKQFTCTMSIYLCKFTIFLHLQSHNNNVWWNHLIKASFSHQDLCTGDLIYLIFGLFLIINLKNIFFTVVPVKGGPYDKRLFLNYNIFLAERRENTITKCSVVNSLRCLLLFFRFGDCLLYTDNVT